MSKPWDNEPTPLTDRVSASKEYSDEYFIREWIESHKNLERRMRAAERLVAEVVAGYEAERDSDFDWIAWYEKAKAHIEATK